MIMNNQTSVAEFILKGFADITQFQALFFVLFLFLYIVALVGNSLIVAAISLSSGLHTPMYFFLVNLALLDVICACTVVPKLLQILGGEDKTISFRGCMTQLYFLTWSVAAELLLFTAMAYDRYVAICQPLHYSKMMSTEVCISLAVAVWGISAFGATTNTSLLLRLSFCGPNVINHFLCEIPSLLPLSCSPTYVNDIMTIVADIFFAILNFLLTMLSYGFIIFSIMAIQTTEGKKRAFSTCSSHLIVVTMYYSTVIYVYLNPGSSYSPDKGKIMAVLYSTVSPTLNPLIYTLRNKDVKRALRKLFIFHKDK
ncbi:olfactory receptor 13A1-like [Dromiciops gliroides]|uniref:olfactory receptor 13A1-like n=1 Tax=Dromiciops gliroides TaxID=33562 RepID=UPI001CC5E295|nr:olfactory receptor 13A1-like [Dromiciops gliroides]